MEKKHIDGLEAVNRARLLMQYSLDKTLSENMTELNVLNEQQSKSNSAPKWDYYDKWKSDYAKSHPDEVWDPNITRDQQYLDSQGKTYTKKVKVGGFVPLTVNNVGLRGTPFGFHPSEYPEYLKKVAEIKKKYPDEESTWYNPTTWFDDNTDDIRNTELEKLKKEYYHEDFPFGITKEDFKEWSRARASLSAQQAKEFDKITKEFSTQYRSARDMPGSDYFLDLRNRNTRNYEMMAKRGVESSFKNVNDFLNALFEYDPVAYKEINKSWLEKKWDDYGWAIELVAWLIVDILSEGMLIPLSEARLTIALQKAVKIALRSGLPVAVGATRSLKAGHITEDAVMDFVFAILPWAHNYFNIAKKPSTQLVESIVSKRAGLNLRNLKDAKKYIKSLTEEEKYFFKKVFMLDKNQLGAGLQKAIKEIGIKGKQFKKVNKIRKQVLTTAGKKIKPSFGKKVGKFLGRFIFLDLPAIEFAEVLARKYGFLDENDKIEALKEEFKKKQEDPVATTILYAKFIDVISKYPDLSANETIKKVNEKYITSIEKAFEIINNEGLLSGFKNEDGTPFTK